VEEGRDEETWRGGSEKVYGEEYSHREESQAMPSPHRLLQ